MSRLGFRKVTVHHGDECLGELDIVPVQGENFQFPNNEIRIHHITATSERCHPHAVLRTISNPVRCKLEPSLSSTLDQSLLINLHASCFYEFKTVVVIVGNEEVHLVAMPSKLKKFPCFWCYSVPIGLYQACLVMLNLRCLAIVFDLDETLIVANTMKSFEDRIDALRSWIARESDPIRLSGMTAEMNRYIEDRSLLKQYTETDSVVDGGKTYKAKLEEVRQLSDTPERGFRPVIRLVEKNVVLTRINPEIRDTSVLVRLRPAWEDLKSYLTAKGRKRFEVYVCTMAERDYALEMWRLLDPEARLISLKQLMDRIVCVNAGAKKSLLTVFQEGNCHPKMAMVIDDRIKVWEDKDQPRVHVVPAFTPYYAPQAEMANAVPVLCVARNVACNVRGGFFKEFDEGLLHKISDVHYEDDVASLTAAPDVSNYLMSEDANLVPNGNPTVPFSEGINGSEADQRLYHLDEKSYLNSSSHAINNHAQPKPELSVAAVAKVQGPTSTGSVPSFEKPSLVGAPFRRDNSLYESDRGVKGKLPIMSSVQDVGPRGLAEPAFMSKLPGPHFAPPYQGGWLAEDAPDRGQLNGRSSGFVQEPNPFKLDKQGHLRQEGVQQNSSTSNNYTGLGSYQNQSMNEHQPEGTSTHISSVAIHVIHEIGKRSNSKVEFRPVVRTSDDLEFSFEVLFAGERIGLGMGKTRKDAQLQAADKALRSLADTYASFNAKRMKLVGKESDKLSSNENGFIWDVAPGSNGQQAAENGLMKLNISKVA